MWKSDNFLRPLGCNEITFLGSLRTLLLTILLNWLINPEVTFSMKTFLLLQIILKKLYFWDGGGTIKIYFYPQFCSFKLRLKLKETVQYFQNEDDFNEKQLIKTKLKFSFLWHMSQCYSINFIFLIHFFACINIFHSLILYLRLKRNYEEKMKKGGYRLNPIHFRSSSRPI